MPAKLCDFEGKPERFSPRSTSQQGDGGQAARIAYRHALVHLLLLFPKNLTPLRALRFSGRCDFRGPRYFKGTHIIIMPLFHPFRKARDCQIGLRCGKLRFPLRERFFNNICAFQNRNFGLAPPICRILTTSAGEYPRVYNMCALIIADRGQSPPIAENRRQQLAEIFASGK